MKIGFIGLGNVGGKLAGTLLRKDFDLTVRDLDPDLEHAFSDQGAHIGTSPAEIMRKNVEMEIEMKKIKERKKGKDRRRGLAQG
jgi:3-hydroxyisobutyrate dehydrogenase-like beta-hydroxyacid dehydrogenase